MISFNTYKSILGTDNIGQAHKVESDMVINSTWDNSLETRTAYFYDVAHDSDPFRLKDMQSDNVADKVPISIKYLENSSQTYAKDTVTYHIQFRPGEDFKDLPYDSYYKDHFENRWGAECPVGLYCDIPDNNGVYRRWLVVGLANFYNAQFSTYEILPCNYTFSWVAQGKKFNVAGVTRTQSSYTSGVWQANDFRTPDDTMKFLLPLTADTARLSYNHRMVVDTKVDVRRGQIPRVFQITKVDRLDSNGLCMYTIKQDLWNADTDYIEYTDTVNYDPASIRGMYCNYYSSTPIREKEEASTVTITFFGPKPEVKVGGGYKKLAVSFSDSTEMKDGQWSFELDGKDAENDILARTSEQNERLAPNEIQVKINDDASLIGKQLIAKYTTTSGETGSLVLSIVGL